MNKQQDIIHADFCGLDKVVHNSGTVNKGMAYADMCSVQ